jgi:uncharacterized C2H2 Zn-finger protein
MNSFQKVCPICNKKFTGLLEYTTHLGKDHRDIHPDRIKEIGKEQKYSFSE